jgi:hypothetical protein
VAEESHFETTFSCKTDVELAQLLCSAFDRRPAFVATNEVEDDDAIVPAQDLRQDAGNAEDTVGSVEADGNRVFFMAVAVIFSNSGGRPLYTKFC